MYSVFGWCCSIVSSHQWWTAAEACRCIGMFARGFAVNRILCIALRLRMSACSQWACVMEQKPNTNAIPEHARRTDTRFNALPLQQQQQQHRHSTQTRAARATPSCTSEMCDSRWGRICGEMPMIALLTDYGSDLRLSTSTMHDLAPGTSAPNRRTCIL